MVLESLGEGGVETEVAFLSHAPNKLKETTFNIFDLSVRHSSIPRPRLAPPTAQQPAFGLCLLIKNAPSPYVGNL